MAEFNGMIETSVVPVIYAAQRATRSSSSNTKYVIPRCKTTTYQKSFIIRACRLWNALVDELNFDTDNISYFKRILLSRGAGRSIIGGGAIFIYSCSAQLTSFEIVI